MNGIVLILSCLIAGKIITQNITYKNAFINTLNRVAINIALPALILDKVHSQTFSSEALFPLLSPWILFGCAAIFVYIVKFFIPLSRSTTGALILLTGTANTSFVGIPLIQAMMGTEAHLGIALWVDQSNFIMLFTLGVLVADFYTGKRTSLYASMKRLLTYPPIIALIFAFLLKPFQYPAYITFTLENLGQLITPLTMISVGAGLAFPSNRSLMGQISLGLVIKLLLVPLTMLGILSFIYSSPNPYINQIVLMQAGMAPMVVATIVAIEKGLDAELSTLLTAIGIPLSFITVPLFYYIIS